MSTQKAKSNICDVISNYSDRMNTQYTPPSQIIKGQPGSIVGVMDLDEAMKSLETLDKQIQEAKEKQRKEEEEKLLKKKQQINSTVKKKKNEYSNIKTPRSRTSRSQSQQKFTKYRKRTGGTKKNKTKKIKKNIK